MAVYTKLKEQDINNILSNYSIGKLKFFKGIQEGIENTNYYLLVEEKKYILIPGIYVDIKEEVLDDNIIESIIKYNGRINQLFEESDGLYSAYKENVKKLRYLNDK